MKNHSNDHQDSTVDARIRENPTRSILVAAGIGVVIGLVVRAIQPSQPASRGTAILKDIQSRLNRLPDRASHLASSGSAMIHDGMDHVRKDHTRSIRRMGKRLMNLFH